MKRLKKIIFALLFLTYIICLLMILFFCRKSNPQIPIEEYFSKYANPDPLKTLMRYIQYVCIRKDTQSVFLALINIGGNFILFLPMGFFLPTLFGKMRYFSHSFCVIVVLIFSSEVFQGVFRVGVPDVDDFLMNLLGAAVGFGIAKLFGF